MLPAHRVIAHREYGNTPPGGWPGRKTDPTYDMTWRRNRVAAFTPRTSQEDDMPYFSQWPHEEKLALADFIVNGVLRTEFPKRGGGQQGTTTIETEIAWLPANLASVVAAVSQGHTDVAALRSVLIEAVREGMAADNAATAEEIVDQLAARLAGSANPS